MSIDWITVAAQIANFLVLVWLLKKFLYRPILDGIDAREAEISSRMQEAHTAMQKAQTAEQEHREQVKALNAQKANINETVQTEAEHQRDAMLAEARQKMERERTDWAHHLDEEARKYKTKLHRAGGDALLSLTRKALDDLADETLEARMAHRLSGQITTMSDDLKSAAGGSKNAFASSRDPLPKSAQAELSASLAPLFPHVELRFETDPAQPPGIILRIGGAQVDWTVDSYIDTLADVMEDKLSKLAVQA